MFRIYQSEIFVVTDAYYYDDCSSDTSIRYYVNTNYGNSISYSDGKLVFVAGSNSRYLRLQTIRTQSTIKLSDLIGKSFKLKINIETSDNVTCSIIIQTPNGDIVTNGDTISSDGWLEVNCDEIPSNTTNVIFNLNMGKPITVNILEWIIYPI